MFVGVLRTRDDYSMQFDASRGCRLARLWRGVSKVDLDLAAVRTKTPPLLAAARKIYNFSILDDFTTSSLIMLSGTSTIMASLPAHLLRLSLESD